MKMKAYLEELVEEIELERSKDTCIEVITLESAISYYKYIMEED